MASAVRRRPLVLGAAAESERGQVKEHPRRHDDPTEAADTLDRCVHQRVEEGRVGQEEEPDDALPARAEGDGQSIGEEVDESQGETGRDPGDQRQKTTHVPLLS